MPAAYPSLDAFLAAGRGALARGPVGLLFCEDGLEAESSLSHLLRIGFRTVLVLGPAGQGLPGGEERAIPVGFEDRGPEAVARAVSVSFSSCGVSWIEVTPSEFVCSSSGWPETTIRVRAGRPSAVTACMVYFSPAFLASARMLLP